MGFLLPQFRVRDRVMVEVDTRHPHLLTWFKWVGTIVEQSKKFRTWNGGQVGYDYSYRIEFDRNQDKCKLLVEARFGTFPARDEVMIDRALSRSRRIWFPGRFLVACTTTLLCRKGRGAWRDTSEDGLVKADYVPRFVPKPEKK